MAANSDNKKNMIVGGLAVVAILVTAIGLGYYFYGGTTPPPPPAEPPIVLTPDEQKEKDAAQQQRDRIVKRGTTGSS